MKTTPLEEEVRSQLLTARAQLGLERLLGVLGISRITLLRGLAGEPLQPGTRLLLATKLQDIPEVKNAA